jgi:hypothetical protein
MPLVGNLRDFALHDFLYLVDRGYKTGSLQLDRPAANEAAHLFFDKGKLLSVIRPNRRERLGELLIRLGKITPQQLAQALHTQQMGASQPLGQLLVDQGVIGQQELQACIQQQIEETVYDLFAWRDGEFKFQTGQRPAPDDVQSLVPLPVENLIMEGVRRVDEQARIRERIPNNDMIVRFVEQPQEKAANINMTADEWRIFARINGRSSINEIAQKTGLTSFQVSHIIFGFITAGLVEVQRSPSAPAASAPTSRPLRADGGVPANRGGAAVAERAHGESRASVSYGGPAYVEPPKKSLVSRLINRIRGM